MHKKIRLVALARFLAWHGFLHLIRVCGKAANRPGTSNGLVIIIEVMNGQAK